jgi:hypothetical protein
MSKTASVEYFDLKEFYKELGIPKKEQDAVTACLTLGLEHYYRHIYGYDKYGERPEFLIAERMYEPYIFGFGAVEVVRHDSLSLETRLKIIQYTFQHIDATAEYGIPHGLPILISFLAGAGILGPALFRSLMITATFGGQLFDDWELIEVRWLFEWLINKADIPDSERLWWLWHICGNGESPQVCKTLSEGLLAHTALSTKDKLALCNAWLTDSPAGEPPAQWEAMQALMRGDVDAFETHLAEAGLPPPEVLPSREAIEAEYDSAIEALLEKDDDGDEPASMPLHLLRHMLVGPLGVMPLTPGALKRVAIASLPALGEDPLKVCKKYLDSDRDYYADAVNQAVAGVIRTYHHRMPEKEVRALVERGLEIGGAPTRKTYYQLGADLFGDPFMKRAEKDSAKSIREWAAKKTSGEAPKRRGRPAKKGVRS